MTRWWSRYWWMLMFTVSAGLACGDTISHSVGSEAIHVAIATSVMFALAIACLWAFVWLNELSRALVKDQADLIARVLRDYQAGGRQ
ncbi:MAG TPA: hypothetical protein VFB66_22235 [Tepidisphaeraceae bacterium]|nr:hypothetical protein [Tepidisphaeraceae bacterium]